MIHNLAHRVPGGWGPHNLQYGIFVSTKVFNFFTRLFRQGFTPYRIKLGKKEQGLRNGKADLLLTTHSYWSVPEYMNDLPSKIENDV